MKDFMTFYAVRKKMFIRLNEVINDVDTDLIKLS